MLIGITTPLALSIFYKITCPNSSGILIISFIQTILQVTELNRIMIALISLQ